MARTNDVDGPLRLLLIPRRITERLVQGPTRATRTMLRS